MRTLNNPELWTSEIEYAYSKTIEDPRNNSAWNQRWFALHEGRSDMLTLENAREESRYALSGAKIDPFNECPWRYLIGVLMEQWRCAQKGGSADDIARITELVRENIDKVKEMYHTWEENPPSEEHPISACVSLLSALVDLLVLFKDETEFLAEAKDIVRGLTVEDPVRRKYWRMREGEISKLLA
jgi:protein farnesyltransferase/geranylgeranyltransferase type-1 subunit alpha